MRATGIVRRIDDLGRVVIPKEIRRTLRIRESEPLEIFTGKEGEIVLKKYSPISEMTGFAKQYVESLSQVSGRIAMVAPLPVLPFSLIKPERHTRSKSGFSTKSKVGI